jgi:glycogen operon protein
MRTTEGEPVVDDSFLLLFNAHYEEIEFKLPTKRFGARWQFALSTAEPGVVDGSRSYVARADLPVESRSIVVLRRGW